MGRLKIQNAKIVFILLNIELRRLLFKFGLRHEIISYEWLSGAVSGFPPAGGRDIFRGGENLPGGGKKRARNPLSTQQF